MEYKEYSESVKRTLAVLQSIEEDNLHMVLGISTEAGELLDVFKKNFAYRKEIDWVNVREEIGDLMWYISNFCTINNLDFEDILLKNVEKLKVRYPEKFTEHDAKNRNLKMERKTLDG